MVELAKSEPGISIVPEDFDKDPLLLTVENGTFNLRTGKLLEHDRNNLITKLAPVVYDRDAECPRWDTFLNQIFDGNREIILFLRRAIGWSISGIVEDQLFFILWGTGANGKSTFLNTISEMLGDYARHTPPETLMAADHYVIPADLARLRGARMVTAVETDAGRSLAESRIKQITGGDILTARHLYGEFFEFKSQFKLFLATNHKPNIKGSDHAIWRRIGLIPFSVRIPAEKQDRELSKKLRTELSGILNWALKGFRDWCENGLNIPTEIAAVTQEYQEEMDTIRTFIEDNIDEQDPKVMTPAGNIYKAYTIWCESSGERPKSQRELGMKLTDKGYQRKKGRDGTFYIGIKLLGDDCG